MRIVINKWKVPFILFIIQILLALPFILEVNLYYYSLTASGGNTLLGKLHQIFASIAVPLALILGFPLFVAGIAFPNTVFANMANSLDAYPYRPYNRNVIIVFYFIWLMIISFIIERIISFMRKKRKVMRRT